jgi:hypothetical protein
MTRSSLAARICALTFVVLPVAAGSLAACVGDDTFANPEGGVGGGDATMADEGTADSTTDASEEPLLEAGPLEAGLDGGGEAGRDASASDSPTEAATSADAGPDAGGGDASDASLLGDAPGEGGD